MVSHDEGDHVLDQEIEDEAESVGEQVAFETENEACFPHRVDNLVASYHGYEGYHYFGGRVQVLVIVENRETRKYEPSEDGNSCYQYTHQPCRSVADCLLELEALEEEN